MQLKERLKELRLKANLTQAELANRIFVSRTLVTKWESGERYPSKDNLARLSVVFQISQEELIGKQKENEKYRLYNRLSIAYSACCILVAVGLLTLLTVATIEKFTLHDAWTGIGGFMVCIVFVLPVIIALVLIEALTLKRKNGYKILELYSLFSVILVWLVSIIAYLYLI